MYKRHETGKWGEYIACKYIERLDYRIIERNFKCKQGEIDIIAWEEAKKELVFIEVKTRKNNHYGKPIEAVDTTKKKHIYQAAQYYVYIHKINNMNLRFDVIEIYVLGKMAKVNHIKQIM